MTLINHPKELEDQIAVVICLTGRLSRRECSIDLKDVIFQIHCSAIWFPFHNKQGTVMLALPKNTNKKQKTTTKKQKNNYTLQFNLVK